MKSRFPAHAAARQDGATLIILLVTLVVITLLTMSTVRTTMTDEKMAGNARDRNKAFQAAEAAVQTCLARVDTNNFAGITLLAPVASPGKPVWEVADNWKDSSANSYEVKLTTSGAASELGLAKNARCMIESLGGSSYRVTGRAVGGAETSVVMLQATYSQD